MFVMRMVFRLCILLIAFMQIRCSKDPSFSKDVFRLNIPAHFPTPELPTDNPITQEKVDLGRKLFFDKALSRTGEVSCGSCHKQEFAFSDPSPVSKGVEGRKGNRNTQPLINLLWRKSFFRDGGVFRLELTTLNAIDDHREFDSDLPTVLEKVNNNKDYRLEFEQAFGDSATSFTFLRALSSFMSIMISGNSFYDKFSQGASVSLSKEAENGMKLFFSSRTNCSSCHGGFNFAFDRFEQNGLYATYEDIGRERITLKPEDNGKFLIPSLRNIAVSAPYMHDGSLGTLEEVVNHYNSGGMNHPGKSELIKPLGLSENEVNEIVAFLQTLTDIEFLNNADFKAKK